MTKQELINWLLSRGYVKDTYGNYRKPNDTNYSNYRFKLNPTSVRHEKQIHFEATQYSKASHEWMRLRSAYYKNLSVTADGKLVGLKM
jgi:hypothetical protein